MTPKQTLEKFGYRIDKRPDFEQVANPKLVERAAAYPGTAVVWDPDDDHEGFMIVGNDFETLAREAVDHLELVGAIDGQG